MRRRLHIIISLLLLVSTTEYLWAQHFLDRHDPIEFESKELEDSEVNEKEGENEETEKLHSSDLDGDLSPQHASRSYLNHLFAGRFSSNAESLPTQKLYILHHSLKIDC